MPEEYQEIIRHSILNEPAFLKATFTGQQHGQTLDWTKVVLRPVLIKEQRQIQFAYYDAKKCITKNYRAGTLAEQLDQLLALPFRNLHVASTDGEIQVNISKKGKPLVTHKKTVQPVEQLPDLAHNRQKEFLLPDGKPDAYLQAIGFMTSDGQIRADKQKKFKQTNEFLKLLQHTGQLEKFGHSPIQIIDCGCGNAYLTFAVYHYLTTVLGLPTEMVGVDVQGQLLEKHAETVQTLGWTGLTFAQSTIADYAPPTPPNIILALHACDTATDEALAQGIQWGSKLIISVPCCHHDLQTQLCRVTPPEPFRPVLRHGILGERMADVLTDSFRALILRIMGYQTDVLQFVSSEHTAKNIMIRAVHSGIPAPPPLIREYQKMKDYWKITPHLEMLLGAAFQARLTSDGTEKERIVAIYAARGSIAHIGTSVEDLHRGRQADKHTEEASNDTEKDDGVNSFAE